MAALRYQMIDTEFGGPCGNFGTLERGQRAIDAAEGNEGRFVLIDRSTKEVIATSKGVGK